MSHRAFLSSTFTDLADHRQYAIEQLRKAGFGVEAMEDWTPDSEAPRRFAPEKVAESDLLVLLVAARRGHVPEGGEKSITESEYEAALSAGLDVLAFLLDDEAPWYPKWDERRDDPRLETWRKDLLENHCVGRFGVKPESLPLGPALTRWLRKEGTEVAPDKGPTRVLILGDEEAGSLASQFHDSLSKMLSIDCRMVPKDSQDITRQAEEAQVIIVSFHSEPDVIRQRDKQFLRDLRPWEDSLFLFAENREDLMEVVDEILLTPHSVFKVKSPEDSERRLLARLSDWRFKHTALVSKRRQVEMTEETPGAVVSRGANLVRGDRAVLLLRASALLAVAATVIYLVKSLGVA